MLKQLPITLDIPVEETVQVSELRYRRLFETAQDGILILDNNSGQIIDVNPFLIKLLGYSENEFIGKKLWEIGVFKDTAEAKVAFDELQTKGYIRYEDLPLQTKAGSAIDVEFVSNVYTVGNQKVIQCNIRDITARKKVEKMLFMQTVALNAAANSIVITDSKGIITWVNPSFTQLTGYTSQEVIGQSTHILYSGKQDSLFYQKFWATILAGNVWKGELTNRKKDGTFYEEEQMVTPVKNKEGTITSFVAIKQDITDRKKAEEIIRLRTVELELQSHSQEQTKRAMLNVMQDLEAAHDTIELEKAQDEAILENMGDGMVAVDKDGKIIIINRAGSEMLGFKGKEILGKNFFDVVTILDEKGAVVPKDKRPIQITLTNNKATKTSATYVCKDGTFLQVSITVTPIILNDEVSGAIEVFRDITKEREIDRLKDEFVSVASHELRTPLTAIDGLVAMILDGEYGAVDENLKQPLKDVNTSSERLIQLVNDMLNLTRIQAGRLKYKLSDFSIADVIAEVVQLLQPISKKNGLDLAIKLTATMFEPVMVQGDPDKIKEVLNNLIGNSLKFTDKGGITVKTNVKEDMVEVQIIDTGIGIAKEDSSKLFGQFQQLEVGKGDGRPIGTGLGLHISRGLIRKMGGELWIEKSGVGKGSVFTFSIPKSKSELAKKIKEEIGEEAKVNQAQALPIANE